MAEILLLGSLMVEQKLQDAVDEGMKEIRDELEGDSTRPPYLKSWIMNAMPGQLLHNAFEDQFETKDERDQILRLICPELITYGLIGQTYRPIETSQYPLLQRLCIEGNFRTDKTDDAGVAEAAETDKPEIQKAETDGAQTENAQTQEAETEQIDGAKIDEQPGPCPAGTELHCQVHFTEGGSYVKCLCVDDTNNLNIAESTMIDGAETENAQTQEAETEQIDGAKIAEQPGPCPAGTDVQCQAHFTEGGPYVKCRCVDTNNLNIAESTMIDGAETEDAVEVTTKEAGIEEAGIEETDPAYITMPCPARTIRTGDTLGSAISYLNYRSGNCIRTNVSTIGDNTMASSPGLCPCQHILALFLVFLTVFAVAKTIIASNITSHVQETLGAKFRALKRELGVLKLIGSYIEAIIREFIVDVKNYDWPALKDRLLEPEEEIRMRPYERRLTKVEQDMAKYLQMLGDSPKTRDASGSSENTPPKQDAAPTKETAAPKGLDTVPVAVHQELLKQHDETMEALKAYKSYYAQENETFQEKERKWKAKEHARKEYLRWYPGCFFSEQTLKTLEEDPSFFVDPQIRDHILRTLGEPSRKVIPSQLHRSPSICSDEDEHVRSGCWKGCFVGSSSKVEIKPEPKAELAKEESDWEHVDEE